MLGDDIFGTLKQEILAETFRSREEIEREREKAEHQRLEKERWLAAHAEALSVVSKLWQKEHPDPFPPTY